MDPARLSALPHEAWERLRFRFQPSVAVADSAWPILDIWEARTRPRQEVEIDLRHRPQRVLVYRRPPRLWRASGRGDGQTRCELVDGPQGSLLQRLLEGRTLGAALAELAEQHGGAEAPAVTQWFAGWAARGLIIACE